MEQDARKFSRKAALRLLAALLAILPRIEASPVWQAVPQKKDILPNPKGTVSLLEKSDRYLLFLQFPGRDLSRILVNLRDGILRVEAPADGSLPPVRREISLGGSSRDGSLGIERSVSRGLLVVTVPKEAMPPSEANTLIPEQDLSQDFTQDDFDAMISEMRRMQREMTAMMGGFPDIAMPAMPSIHAVLQGSERRGAPRGDIPSLEDAGDRYVVRVSLPGQDLSKVNVNLRDRRLTIEASNESTAGSAGFRMARSFRYSRAMNLPGPVLVGKMKVDRLGEELVVTLPKLGS